MNGGKDGCLVYYKHFENKINLGLRAFFSTFDPNLIPKAVIDTLQIKVTENSNPRLAETEFQDIPFGKIFTDHMFMADFEDANSPTFFNMVEGQANLKEALLGTLNFTSKEGKVYQLNEKRGGIHY